MIKVILSNHKPLLFHVYRVSSICMNKRSIASGVLVFSLLSPRLVDIGVSNSRSEIDQIPH